MKLDEPTARSAAVAVVGAGVTGLSVAWQLAQLGVRRVVVVDRAGVAAGASGVQPGGVRQQWSTRVSCELARESVAFYRDLGGRLGIADAPRLDPCGYLFLAHTGETLAQLAASVELQNALGVPSRLLTPAETADLVEGLDPELVVGASYCAEDGYFDRPQAVVEAFAEAARAAGVAVEQADVTALRPDGDGWAVERHGAQPLRADQVVVAAGADSAPLLAGLAPAPPIERERRYLFFSEPIAERLLEPLVVSGERRFAAKQLANGRVLASDLGAEGDPDDREDGWRRHVRECIGDLAPRLLHVSFPLLVSGEYDVTPDHQPLLGRVGDRPGLWLAAGFSGHGFMIAPAVGRVVAAAIAGDEPSAWLDELAAGRFDTADAGARPVERQVV